MKLGCSSWSYDRTFREGLLNQLTWVRLCAEELELDGVELLDLHFPRTDEDYLRTLKKACTDLQLTISCVSVSNDFGLLRAGEHREQFAKVKEWVETASFLGAPVVRVMAGWVHREEKREVRSGGLLGPLGRLFAGRPDPKKEAWPQVMAALRQSADYAARRGIVLAVENHDRGGFVGTAEEVERCLQDVRSTWVRLCLDTGDYGDLGSIRRTLSHAVHVHAKLYELDSEGVEKRLKWPRIIDILRKGGYRGFLSIEYEGEEDPATAVPRGAGYLRRLLREAEG